MRSRVSALTMPSHTYRQLVSISQRREINPRVLQGNVTHALTHTSALTRARVRPVVSQAATHSVAWGKRASFEREVRSENDDTTMSDDDDTGRTRVDSNRRVRARDSRRQKTVAKTRERFLEKNPARSSS